MRRDEPLPADARADAARPVLSAQGRAELLVAVLAIVAALYLLPAAKAWLQANAAAVQTSALAHCRPPAALEQLHIVVEHRPDGLATTCMYLGSKGTYARPHPQRR